MELWTVLEAWNRGTYHVFRNREDNPQKSILYSGEEQRKALDFFLNENVSSWCQKLLFLSVWPPSYVISGGECHEDAVNELVKEGEIGAEEETQKTKGTKRKAESILAR